MGSLRWTLLGTCFCTEWRAGGQEGSPSPGGVPRLRRRGEGGRGRRWGGQAVCPRELCGGDWTPPWGVTAGLCGRDVTHPWFCKIK